MVLSNASMSSIVTTLVAVELGTQSDQLLDTARSLVHEHPHRVDIAQPGTCGERVGCDLIAMGKHGRNRLADVMIGSVTRHVMGLSPCDVLVAT